MSPRNIQDRNNINLGPARLKVEDEIYQAADQGITGSTTVEQVTPEEPTTPVVPGGDLISPPVLQGDYPVYADNLPYIYGFDDNRFNLLLEVPLTSQGYFERSLIVTDGIIVNVDNQLQVANITASNALSPRTTQNLPIAYRNGVVWFGHWYMNPSNHTLRTMGSLTMVHSTRGSVTTTDYKMRIAWQGVYSDGDFYYLSAQFGNSQPLSLFKVPVSGDWEMIHVCDITGSNLTSPTGSVTTHSTGCCVGVYGDTAWTWFATSSTSPTDLSISLIRLIRTNINTGVSEERTGSLPIGYATNPRYASWVTKEGHLAYITNDADRFADVVYLVIISKFSLTYTMQPLLQPSTLTPDGKTWFEALIQTPCKPPGAGTMLCVPYLNGLILEFDIHGYRDPGFPGGYSDPEYPSAHSTVMLDHANSTPTSSTFYWTSLALPDVYGGTGEQNLPYKGARWWRAYVNN